MNWHVCRGVEEIMREISDGMWDGQKVLTEPNLVKQKRRISIHLFFDITTTFVSAQFVANLEFLMHVK